MMADERQVRLHAVVDGVVQGVGFRAFVLDVADLLNVTGWVRNTSDGKVEVIAEGPRDRLEDMLKYLRRGPRASIVDNVETEWQEATGEFNRFDVARTLW